MSINKWIGVGRLVRDPDLRYSPQGTAVCNFNIAVNRNFKSNDGKDADFINCVTFKKSAESLANYQRKGNLLGIEGRLQSRSYEKDGRTVYVTEVVCDNVQFLDPKKDNQEQQNNQQGKTLENEGEPFDQGLPF